VVESGRQVPQDGDAVRLSALEVEELVRNTVAGALQVVGDVSTLAFRLEGGTSPQIDSALQEAQAILEVLYMLTQQQLFKSVTDSDFEVSLH
jgi:hypothetical protein